jgi:hypothetical protein
MMLSIFYNISMFVITHEPPEFWKIVIGAFIGAVIFHFVLRYFNRHDRKKKSKEE